MPPSSMFVVSDWQLLTPLRPPTPLFLSPADADELAAACGMFISPAKVGHTSGAANKPRKLFLEESVGRPTDDRGGLGDLHAQLSPAMWIPAA
jgi:hypothetical protein